MSGGVAAPVPDDRPVRPVAARHGLRHFTGLLSTLAEAPTPDRGNWLFFRDARAKVVTCMLLAVTATVLSSLASLIWCLGFGWLLLLSIGASFRRYAFFFAPPFFFTAMMTLPACLNIVTPGRDLFTICRLPEGAWGWWYLPPELTVTAHGVFVAARVLTRALAAITATFVLVATTRPDRLWFGLRGLGVPSLFVVLLSMMYRYLDLLARVGAEMHLARLSRTLGRMSGRDERRWIAAGIASLFRRARMLAESVHRAMLSRGYGGEVKLLRVSHWRWPDTALVGGTAAVCAVLLRLS